LSIKVNNNIDYRAEFDLKSSFRLPAGPCNRRRNRGRRPKKTGRRKNPAAGRARNNSAETQVRGMV